MITLLPGRSVPVAITLENKGTNDIRDMLQLELRLSAAEKPSDLDLTLLLAWLPVNLAVGEKLSINEDVTLQAGPQPPLDVAGPRRLLLSIYNDAMERTNIIASECFWMGEVLNVITHGFKPNPFESDEDFLHMSYAIKSALESIPEKGSILEGRIRSYVSDWESSEGFWMAFFSLFAAKIAEAEGLNLFTSGQSDKAIPLLTFAQRAK
jgi:hypothetical protein